MLATASCTTDRWKIGDPGSTYNVTNSKSSAFIVAADSEFAAALRSTVSPSPRPHTRVAVLLVSRYFKPAEVALARLHELPVAVTRRELPHDVDHDPFLKAVHAVKDVVVPDKRRSRKAPKLSRASGPFSW